MISRPQRTLGTPLQASVEVRDIAEARRFYLGVLGCSEGLSDEQQLNLNLCGHPIVCHLNPQMGRQGRVVSHYHHVDGKYGPVPHCIVVLEKREWHSLGKRLKQHNANFVIEPYRHLEGAQGVQATLLLRDPSGNALEVSLSAIAREILRCERQRALAEGLQARATIDSVNRIREPTIV